MAIRAKKIKYKDIICDPRIKTNWLPLVEWGDIFNICMIDKLKTFKTSDDAKHNIDILIKNFLDHVTVEDTEIYGEYEYWEYDQVLRGLIDSLDKDRVIFDNGKYSYVFANPFNKQILDIIIKEGSNDGNAEIVSTWNITYDDTNITFKNELNNINTTLILDNKFKDVLPKVNPTGYIERKEREKLNCNMIKQLFIHYNFDPNMGLDLDDKNKYLWGCFKGSLYGKGN